MFNKEEFMHLVPCAPKDAKENNSSRIYTTRLPLDDYQYDYSHAIVTYLKKCGCKINRTNWNIFGGFYIYYTSHTKYIDPSDFADNYKGGVHLDSRSKGIIWAVLLLLVVLLVVFLLAWLCL